MRTRILVLPATLAVLGAACSGKVGTAAEPDASGRGDIGFVDLSDGPTVPSDGPASREGAPATDGPAADGPLPPPGACAANDQCANNVCLAGACATAPLAAAYAGQATFALDSSGLGKAFGMHFLSVHTDGTSPLQAYYIDNVQVAGAGRSRVGRATSSDGVTFVKQGVALEIGGSWEKVYQAATDLSHQTGAASAGGWEAVAGVHQPGHMIFGPYVTFPHAAAQLVSFSLRVDSTVDHVKLADLDVYDATAKQVITARALHRDELAAANVDQIVNLAFAPVIGHQYEFRVYWYGNTYTRVATVATATSTNPPWDDRLASFPGVLKDGASWLLAYEGAGLSSAWPGDVGLVSSSDGASFVRSRAGPFLAHATSGWERVNIGTPSLHKQGGSYYLYYHGFDGVDVQIGLATFTAGGTPKKHPSNPILKTSASGWDSGTVGKRSRILSEGGYHYMAYEGSTEQPFASASWSSGLARSTDLVSWSKSPVNPVIPVSVGSFGNDGPELVRFEQRIYLYVRGPGNSTSRYLLRGKP